MAQITFSWQTLSMDDIEGVVEEEGTPLNPVVQVDHMILSSLKVVAVVVEVEHDL